ncbi:MAG: helix-turn-helix domain-containing protein [Nitrososphaerales archaeon]
MQHESLDFVISSETRLRILAFLSKDMSTPTQLAQKIEKHLSHVSRALRELEEKQLVSCVNPSYTKPRLYSLTPEGQILIREVERHNLRVHPV